MMFKLTKKISRTRNLPSQNSFVLFLIALLALGLLMTGCSFPSASQPEVVAQPPTPKPAEPTPTPEPPQQADTATSEPTQAPVTVANVSQFPDAAQYPSQQIANGLAQPVFLTHAGDSSGRLFIIEKPGTIRILQDGELLPTPFLNIVGQVDSEKSERGLLGLAFHPNYAENGRFFIDYTDLNGNTVIAGLQVSADPNIADPDSQQILLTITQPYANHNGGMIAFGPDSYLYIGMGDGGSGGDPQGNAQNPDSLLGKILRIDVDSASPYGIPEGNSPTGRPEIWALGLRNPWRFSFDRATGDLFIGDVGQNQWEEIDILPAGILGGINLGWNYIEGTHSYEGTPPAGVEFISPVIEYQHGGGSCSVTGGYVYRGSLPEWQGIYLYGDYCTGKIWGALANPDGTWQTTELFATNLNLVSFGEDQAGELYAVFLNGEIHKLLTGMP